MTDLNGALERLRSGEESVRRRAVAELARTGEARAIPALLLSVGDESWPVRQAAAEALAAFAEDALLPELEKALRDGDDAGLRNAAMEIYVKAGPSAADALLALLGDQDEEVR